VKIEDFLGIMSQWQGKSYRWILSFTNIDTTQSMDNDSQIGISSPTLFRIVSPHLTSQQKQSQQFPLLTEHIKTKSATFEKSAGYHWHYLPNIVFW
jgi:hypothetical protein